MNVGVAALDSAFHLIDGIKHRGVVLVQLLTDIRCAEVGQLADQINGNLSCLGGTLVFQCAAQDRFVDGVELADLADD